MARDLHASFNIRELTTHEEFARALELQQEIWGFADVDLLPLRLFVVASKIGGQILGAFEGSRMVAFCLCIPGLKPGGQAYLHSHMLGVLKPYRNTGLGRSLKLKQREFALAQGVHLIEWTFDPLEVKNAFFNIERLGAIVRRYVPNQYGITSSNFQGSLPTDRLIAEWWIASDRVRSIVEQTPPLQRTLGETIISVPSNISQMKLQQPVEARVIQERMEREFDEAFRSGLAVTGFEKTEAEGRYLLGEWRG